MPPSSLNIALACVCFLSLTLPVFSRTAKGSSGFLSAFDETDQAFKSHDAQKLSAFWDCDQKELSVKPGVDTQAAAWAYYSDEIDKIGWAKLHIRTNPEVDSEVQMYAAGYLEGSLTHRRMAEFLSNINKLHGNDRGAMGEVYDFFSRSIAFVKSQIAVPVSQLTLEERQYWRQVALSLKQLEGILDGYNSVAPPAVKMTMEDLMLLNSDGEIPELMTAFSADNVAVRKTLAERSASSSSSSSQMSSPVIVSSSSSSSSSSQMSTPEFTPSGESNSNSDIASYSSVPTSSTFSSPDPDDLVSASGAVAGATTMLQESSILDGDMLWELRMIHSHCSALVKLTPGNKDLFVAHTTWDDFSEMIRIFKSYNFPLKEDGVVGTHIFFSSYPGCVSSTDDYYTINTKLVVLETTLEILDESLYRKLETEKAVPNFFRIMVANRLANSGKEWVNIFSKNNGGTYNSQWMVIDYKKFHPGQTPSSDLLWILEQVPGEIQSKDMTEWLAEKSYWASYNRPFFDHMYEAAGFLKMRRYGTIYSKDDNPRARLFKRLHKDITDLEGMKYVMQHNDWQHDDDSQNSPGHAISPRFDLNPIPALRRTMGGIDTKITSSSMVDKMEIEAISGPSHQEQPVFRFTGEWLRVPHDGLPEVWDFDWVRMKPMDQF